MTDPIKRLASPENRKGVEAALAYCIAEAHRIRSEAMREDSLAIRLDGARASEVIDNLAARIRGLLP